MGVLIAFDQSTTKFGFAVGSDTDPAPKTGVITAPGADEMVFDRTLVGLSETVSLLCRNMNAEYCIIEAPLLIANRDAAAHTAMALIQLTGAVRAAAARAGCKVTLTAVSTVRRHFIGVGNMRSAEAKRAVIARCRQLGWTVEDDNAADAAALWSYGMSIKFPKWSPQGTPLFAARAGV